MERDITVQL